MSRQPSIQARPIAETGYPFRFTVCTLVTNRQEYDGMLQSFAASGFGTDTCEFLYADNTDGNQFDAYRALNKFLREAGGRYIIICHQDVLINQDDISRLEDCLAELDAFDPDWAVCGNAGGAGPNHVVYHITYPERGLVSKGRFPLRVSSLDENFILVKNSACLKVAGKQEGFHLYATDLCLQAELNGWSSYVIAFNLTHKSSGNRNEAFYAARKRMIERYDRFFRGRWIQTNSTVFYLSGSWLGRLLCGNPLALFLARMWNGMNKKR